MAKKKTRVQEPRGPGPKGSIPRVAEPKKKPWAMSIERAQVKPLRELPPTEKKPLAIMKIKAPITEQRKGKPVPPPPPKRVKPAPRRSPTLKWHKKGR